MSEKEYLILLSTFVSFGPARMNLLLSYFGSARKTWNARREEFSKIGLKENTATEFLRHRENISPTDYFNRLNRLSISTLAKKDKGYPLNLKEIGDAPLLIYVKGQIKPRDELAVAIVGSRKMTAYGKEVTERFSTELTRRGITIISGLARGIDTEAHKGALLVKGRTIAVVGSGLDKIYPPENFRLAAEIGKSGALISEYPLGYPARPINFAARNRIISGMSKAVLVVEGAQKSGTFLTASHAAEQGREVFAIPGQITSPLASAPLTLLKSGARIATEPSDLLEELGVKAGIAREAVEKIMPASEEEEKILENLSHEALHLDELARITSIEVGNLSARLTIMELKGMVRNMGGGVYKKL